MRTRYLRLQICRRSAQWKVALQRSSGRYQRYSNDNFYHFITIFRANTHSAVSSKPTLYLAVPTQLLVGSILPFALYPSCLPNAHNSWNSVAKCETIHAIRSIDAGEEITISYDKGGPSGSRRTHLKDAFGFVCDCSVCSLSPLELQTSDVRRLQIQHLDDAIGDPNRVMEKARCLSGRLSLLASSPRGRVSWWCRRFDCKAVL